MATKTIKLEIPFQKFLSLIDQLDPEEKLFLKKKLEKQNVTTWQKKLENVLDHLGKKNIGFSEKKVAEDVKKAIAEVRISAKNLDYLPYQIFKRAKKHWKDKPCPQPGRSQ